MRWIFKGKAYKSLEGLITHLMIEDQYEGINSKWVFSHRNGKMVGHYFDLHGYAATAVQQEDEDGS